MAESTLITPNDQGNSHRTTNSFTLLYLFYSAKLGSQVSIYFIWLVDWEDRIHSRSCPVFAIIPFFHVIVHVFSAKPLSNSTFIAYLCFRRALSLFHNEFSNDISSKLPARNPLV